MRRIKRKLLLQKLMGNEPSQPMRQSGGRALEWVCQSAGLL